MIGHYRSTIGALSNNTIELSDRGSGLHVTHPMSRLLVLCIVTALASAKASCVHGDPHFMFAHGEFPHRTPQTTAILSASRQVSASEKQS